MSQLDVASLRPAYNGTALAASIITTAPYWGAFLTTVATQAGSFAPLGLTAAALIVGWRLDRTHYVDRDGHRHDWWIPRVLLWTCLTGPLLATAARLPLLNFLIGAHL